MAAAIPDSHRDLLERPLIAALATSMADGTPQVTAIWFNYEDGAVYFNTARGRLKDRNITARPYVALMVYDPQAPTRYIQLRGPVVEQDEEQGLAHIDALSRRYDGKPWTPVPGQQRVRFKLLPERVDTHN
jgi:PPOX class probable F420-dependent enzyme